MPKFRKKPIVIEAIKLETQNILEVLEFIDQLGSNQSFDKGIIIPTDEGKMLASYGDWVIKGIKGEFYPCKPDVFEQTYEPIEE